jgi:hypothetical protein
MVWRPVETTGSGRGGGLMEYPAKVLVYNQLLSLSGTQGLLVALRAEGSYEIKLPSQGKVHTVLLPIAQTALVLAEPEPEVTPGVDIER